MSRPQPVDPRVRLAITQWPPDAPRGSVSTFCLEHGIARKTFYAIRNRAIAEGQAAALEPRTRRPAVSPNRISDEVKAAAVGIRAALEQSGLDHGPISVHEKMRSLGMEPVPGVSSLARIFRDAGVARLEPRKKPRASYRRFVYPAPNACWQLDGTEYLVGTPLGDTGLRERDITVLTLHRGTTVILNLKRGMVPERRPRRRKVRKLPKDALHVEGQ